MKYLKGFKYQLHEEMQWQTYIYSMKNIDSDFVKLSSGGMLTLKKGFAWDGTSGPVMDRKSNMKASAIHDALYRLMRKGKLEHDYWRQADSEFKRALKEAGAWSSTIWIDMKGLAIANGSAAHPKNKQKIYEV